MQCLADTIASKSTCAFSWLVKTLLAFYRWLIQENPVSYISWHTQVNREEVSGPEAEAAIARITQQPPNPSEGSSSDPQASKPPTSALAEHDAAFPAIGAMNGIAGIASS